MTLFLALVMTMFSPIARQPWLTTASIRTGPERLTPTNPERNTRSLNSRAFSPALAPPDASPPMIDPAGRPDRSPSLAPLSSGIIRVSGVLKGSARRMLARSAGEAPINRRMASVPASPWAAECSSDSLK